MAIERGTVIDGKYEILKEIGRGGMSVVYLAMDNRLNKQWAVKVLQRQGIGKNNEIIINKVPDDTELMKRLDHPAIPRIVDIIDRPDDPQIYIVMDYVEGESLDKVLEEFGAQPQDLVIDWAKQICDTLGYLHSQKPPIIYRDMKPANIMLKPEGNVKLIDFGIAREFKEQNLADTTALGTRGYASPEHFGGRTDARSDIYTLGMTMHHLLTGADPRPKSYEYFPIREYNPELSSGLEHIIDKCTAWDPDDRYQNCNELMYDLEHYNEIDDDFRKKQKNKLLMFIISASLAFLFAVIGISMILINQKANEQNYTNLIQLTGDDLVNNFQNINNAIKIDPSRIDAYNKFFEYTKQHGAPITKAEKENLASLAGELDNAYKNQLISENEYAEFLYEVGKYTFIHYDEETLSEKAAAANEFFQYLFEYNGEEGSYNQKVSFNNVDKAKIYFTISNSYSLNLDDRLDYSGTYQAIKEAIKLAESDSDIKDATKLAESDSEKIVLYKVALDYISSNIGDLVNNDKISEEDLLDLIQVIENNYSSLGTKTELTRREKNYIKQIKNYLTNNKIKNEIKDKFEKKKAGDL